ncbi:MAG TPA: hypothetical protein VNF04_09080 [Stellaceae bacterium]|nr:hypothetical protein [Stellaceae bacterium]
MNDTINGVLLAIAVLIGVLFLIFLLSRSVREDNAKIEALRAARPSAPVPPAATPASRPVPQIGSANPALAWNVVVIVVGVLIAIIGLINGLAADPLDSALRQTVSALWVIQGLLGLLIAAVGILGAGMVHAADRFTRKT